MVLGVEKDLDSVKKEIRRLSVQARLAQDPLEQHKLQSELKSLERQKKHLRTQLFDVEDTISGKRDSLIDKIEKRMRHEHRTERLFALRWTII